MVFLFGATFVVVLELRSFLVTDDVGGMMWTHEGGFGCVILLWTGRKVLVVVVVVVVVLWVALQIG